MRIGILAHGCRAAGGLSVGLNIVSALRRVADEHDYLLVLPAACGYERLDFPSRSTVEYHRRSLGWLGRAQFDFHSLPKVIRTFQPDVLFALASVGVPNPPCKQALLFHRPDAIYPRRHRRGRGWLTAIDYAVFLGRLRLCLPCVHLVFCQTEVAKDRFARFRGYSGPIEVMPNAVSEFSVADVAQAGFPSLHDHEIHFVLLCLTMYYPHKNIETIVELFRRFPDRLRTVRCVLTLQADQHPRAARLIDRIERLGLSRQIVNVGPLRQEQLASYFREADALFLPTVLESFSGTYLEAMYFGRPILTSDLDFAHAVCGDAALYFDPWNTESVCRAIESLRDDANLQRRLVQLGHARRRHFVRSWDSVVSNAMDCLTALVRNKATLAPT
ncbi:MAG: glycosyltransferase [Planctomycetota bacterium]|jgi:glycosyltransferase involved in cell wall biosynthesis